MSVIMAKNVKRNVQATVRVDATGKMGRVPCVRVDIMIRTAIIHVAETAWIMCAILRQEPAQNVVYPVSMEPNVNNGVRQIV